MELSVCLDPGLGEDEIGDMMGAGGTGVQLLLCTNNVCQQISNKFRISSWYLAPYINHQG